MSKLRGVSAFLRAELGAISPLVPLVVLAVAAALVLTGGGVTMAYPAFQSPVDTPTATQTAEPSQPPTQTPVAPPEQPTESPPVPPTESPPVPPTEVPGEMETPTGAPQPSPSEMAPEPTLEATPEPTEGTGGSEEGSPATRGASWAVLIDTFVVGLSSLWLCCGAIVLVLFVLGVIASFLLRAE